MATLSQIFKISADITNLVQNAERGAKSLEAIEKSADRSAKALTTLEQGAKSFGSLEGAMTRAVAVGKTVSDVFERIALAIGRGVVDAFKDAVRLSSEFHNALMGLGSIASAFGSNIDEAKRAAVGLASDGLMTVTEAASGLKNLLATGFALPEAITLMSRFKDTAAFSRQASFEFGQAVVRATEGIRLGLSTVSDAAGMTKNLGQILKENGAKAEDLSRVQSDLNVRMALFRGILKETEPQLGDATRLLGTYSGAVSQLQTSWSRVLIALGDAVTQNATVARAITAISNALNGASAALGDTKRGFDIVSGAVIIAAKGLGFLSEGFGLIVKAASFVVRGVDQVAISLGNVLKAGLQLSMWAAGGPMSPLAGPSKAAIEALDKAILELTIRQKAAADAALDADRRFGGWSERADQLAAELEKTRGLTVSVGNSVAQRVVPAVAAMAKETEATTVALREAVPEMRSWWKAVSAFADETPAPTMADLGDKANYLAHTVFPQFKLALSDIGFRKATEEAGAFTRFITQNLGRTLSQAFTGGGGLGGALKSLSVQMFDEDGPLGFGAGGMLNGLGNSLTKKLGTAVGMALPGLGSLIGVGLGAVGGLFGKIFDDPEKKINPIREAFVQAAGGLEALNQKAHEAGVTLNALLDAKNPKQYEAAIKSLTDALEFQKSAMRQLQETTQRYGFTIEELGPALQRQRLDVTAQQLFKDFEVLTSAGIDINTVITRMGDSINEFVQSALATGTEIPQAMQPMLQKMVEMGLLTDENGNIFASLEEAGVTFTMTMSEGFRGLIDEVKKLTDAISRGLGLAIKSVPPIDIPVNVQEPNAYDMYGAIPMADGGAGMVDRPTLFLAGERGPEQFAFSGANRGFGGGDVTVVVENIVDGRVVNRTSQRVQSQDLQRRTKLRAA